MVMFTREHTTIKNLEFIEYTRQFCDIQCINHNYFLVELYLGKSNNSPTLEQTISKLDILERLPEDIVSDIDGFDGIGEWGPTQNLLPDWDDCMDEDVSRELDMLQNVGGSNYEKYYNEVDGKWDDRPSIERPFMLYFVIHG